MGEMWMGIWVFTLIGFLVIAISIYDYMDRKKRGQEIKRWKYAVVIAVGLALMFPILSGIVRSILFPLYKILRPL